jgi:hypothetical protein
MSSSDRISLIPTDETGQLREFYKEDVDELVKSMRSERRRRKEMSKLDFLVSEAKSEQDRRRCGSNNY